MYNFAACTLKSMYVHVFIIPYKNEKCFIELIEIWCLKTLPTLTILYWCTPLVRLSYITDQSWQPWMWSFMVVFLTVTCFEMYHDGKTLRWKWFYRKPNACSSQGYIFTNTVDTLYIADSRVGIQGSKQWNHLFLKVFFLISKSPILSNSSTCTWSWPVRKVKNVWSFTSTPLYPFVACG